MRINCVVIGYDGLTVSLEDALKAGVKPEVVFERHDGLRVACTTEFEKTTYELFEKEWVGFARRPDKSILPMNRYNPPPDKKELSFWE